jgi:lathosterol oxidase
MPTWLEMPRDFLGIVLFQFVAAVLLYVVLASASHAAMRLFKRAAEFPGNASERGQFGPAVGWTLVSLGGNAVLAAPFQYWIANGRSAVYRDVAERGWAWLVVSAVIMLVVTESAIYWIHRGLHTRFGYRHFHRIHHRFRVPTPWASLAFHPLDAFAQGLPHFLCALVLPVHIGVYTTFVVGVTAWAVTIHDRTSLVRVPGLNYTGHHTVHHLFNKWNYGQFFTFWDRLCGTYRSPVEYEKRPAEVPILAPPVA